MRPSSQIIWRFAVAFALAMALVTVKAQTGPIAIERTAVSLDGAVLFMWGTQFGRRRSSESAGGLRPTLWSRRPGRW
ncbi:MAG TPA: hypothetical protein VF921_19220 [Vicinamibacterales bacterium]